MELSHLLALMVVYASIDSINLCAISTTAVLALYSSTLMPSGIRKLALPAFFICGVYLGYVLVGLALSFVLVYYKVLLTLVVGLAVILLILDIREALKKETVACKIGECLPAWIQRLPMSLLNLGAFIYGVVVSWSFMLCSAAPYLIFLSMLSQYMSSWELRALIIALYCLIIIAPLIIVASLPVVLTEYISINLRTLLLARSLLLSIVALLGVYYLFMTSPS